MHCRSSTAYCPWAARQCIAGVALPIAPGGGGDGPPLVCPPAGDTAGGLLAGAGLGGSSGGPPHVPGRRALRRWHPPPLRHCPGGQRLSPRSAINVVTTPSHWITDLNVRVDAATREPPEVDLTWLLRRPYSFIPPVPFRDQCQLSPTALSDWLQDRASIPAQAIYEARWGVNFMPGGGLPLDWFDHDQQRHITAHRMDNVPTMAVLAHRSSHRGTVLDTTCLLCGTQPETAPHLWACSAQSHEWGPARRRLAAWLDQKVGPRAAPVRHQLWEPTVLEQWAAALRTPSMQLAHLECTRPHSLGTEFLRHVVEESIRIWYAHAKARATLLKARLGPGSTMAWALQELRLHQQAEREGVQRELLE